MERKRILYIGHDYHRKTKSTGFLQQLLEEHYSVDYCYYSYDTNDFIMDNNSNKEYDYLVVFQVSVSVEKLRTSFKYKQAIYFPMYDDTGMRSADFWIDYLDFNIINFSYTLHEKLKNMGLSSYYVQYFPEPKKIDDFGDFEDAFMWQRVDPININNLSTVLEKLGITKVHLHMSPDPYHHEIYPNKSLQNHIAFSYSDWFETREEMEKIIGRSAIYFAPRVYEGIGMSFLEAMAMGRCVVGCDNPTMNEYIINGWNGILFDDKYNIKNSNVDIRSIQNNAMEYIKNGFEKWQIEKNSIYDWIESKPKIDKKRIKRTEASLFGKSIHIGSLVFVGKKGNRWFILKNIPINEKLIKIMKKIIKKEK